MVGSFVDHFRNTRVTLVDHFWSTFGALMNCCLGSIAGVMYYVGILVLSASMCQLHRSGPSALAYGGL
eukprot:12795447-Heterocapsa_arctica.AAC.1